MNYSLEQINMRATTEPEKFVRDCDDAFAGRISHAADMIAQNMSQSPIVLLSGPSGSGKTTTARKLSRELSERGIKTYAVSMDNYFKTIDLRTAPRDENGEIDYESPKCVDMELMNEHFSELSRGNEIKIPKYIFSRQKRSASEFTPMRLAENEVAIFEGIHALNDEMTDTHPEAFGLYISAASDVESGGETVFTGPWMRLVRRIVRDSKFRGASADFTLALWDNIMRGEKKFISPFIHKAKLTLDSSLPYEVPIMKRAALPLLENVSPDTDNYEELCRVRAALEHFCELDEKYVDEESLLREFIGGGIYNY